MKKFVSIVLFCCLFVPFSVVGEAEAEAGCHIYDGSTALSHTQTFTADCLPVNPTNPSGLNYQGDDCVENCKEIPGSSCQGDDEEPPCEPHDCGLPPCPPKTTSTPNNYLIRDRVSCDMGCDETKHGNCYEIPPDCDPSITHVRGVSVTTLLDQITEVKGANDNCIPYNPSNPSIVQDHENSAVHSDSQVNINTDQGNTPVPGTTIISGTNQTSGTTNSLGCKSETWSGVEINNPVQMEAHYWSTRDVNRVEAIYFWMSKEGEQAGASSSRTTTTNTLNSWSPSGQCGICGPNGQCFTIPCSQFGANSQSQNATQTATAYELKYLMEQQVSSGKTATNSGFGFMVRRINGVLSDVYIPKTGGSKAYWAKIGTVGNDFYIYGPNSKPMVKVSGLNISQDDKITAKFNLTFLNERSGVSNYEKVAGGMYNLYTMANDIFGFTPKDNYPDDRGTTDRLPYEQNQIRFYNHWKQGGKWGIDITAPKLEKSLQPVVTSPSVLSLAWQGTDGESSILHSIGNAFRIQSDIVKNSDIIYPAGSGRKVLLNYRQPNTDILGQLNGSNILWSVSNVSSRDERIDLTDNRGGSVEFFVTLFDQGCNHTQDTTDFNLNEWIQTKGGYFYSRGGTIINTKSLTDGLWKVKDLFNKYDVKETEADLGTELLGGYVNEATRLRTLLRSSTNQSYRAINFDGIKKSDVYANYLDKVRKLSNDSVVKVNRTANTTLSGSLSSSCDNPSVCKSKGVVYTVEGDITVNSGFKCDGRAVIFATGNIMVNPDVTNSTATSACIFFSGGDLSIVDGNKKSSVGSIGFDQLDGYYIANGTLTISKEKNSNTERPDALFVEGGLVSFGEGRQASIVLLRELHLEDRNIYPALNVIHHAKYGKLMTEVFGGERLVFKSEIGYKD